MSDKKPTPTPIPATREAARDFIADEAEACVALLQPALDAMADRWANDPPELLRVRLIAQTAAMRGFGDWMLDVLREKGATREEVLAVHSLTASMTDAFARNAALQRAEGVES